MSPSRRKCLRDIKGSIKLVSCPLATSGVICEIDLMCMCPQGELFVACESRVQKETYHTNL